MTCVQSEVITLLEDSDDDDDPPAPARVVEQETTTRKEDDVIEIVESDGERKPSSSAETRKRKSCWQHVFSEDENDDDDTDDETSSEMGDLGSLASASLASFDNNSYADSKPPPHTSLGGIEDSKETEKDDDGDDDDDDIVEMIVPAEPTFVPAAASLPATSGGGEDEDEEIELVGTIGQNALVDFPHSRESCVLFPFQVDHKKHCPNCYCFVCDVKVQECEQWDTHCAATYKNPAWRQARAAKKNGSPAPIIIPTTPPRAAAPNVVTPQQLRVFAIVPHFMNNAEIWESVTRVYAREENPPTPPFRTTLRHYQRQSLAFMRDVEKSNDRDILWQHNGLETRGGWLADQVGMGKSAVVIALIAMDSQEVDAAIVVDETIRALNVTVVLTSVSLMGQWKDEFQKHAPHLKVKSYHRPSGSRIRDIHHLQGVDVILSTATFGWDRWLVEGYSFRRVVMDESHLLGTSSASRDLASRIRAPLRWCVSATPFHSSTSELSRQYAFLGLPSDKHLSNGSFSPALLAKHMIRHVKTQDIQGSVALVLPPSTTEVRSILLTPAERDAYDAQCHNQCAAITTLQGKSSAAFFTVQNRIIHALSTPLLAATSSKLQVLKEEIQLHLALDPNMRIVVFTQFRAAVGLVRSLVKSLGMKDYSFDGSTGAGSRSKAIHDFQSTDIPGPAVFCTTLKTGSVGITLTRATHVYLLEPCIQPADEVQAAGRIHRLGQTRPVRVTRLVYQDTHESNIVRLHQEIHAGRVSLRHNGIPRHALSVLLQGLALMGLKWGTAQVERSLQLHAEHNQQQQQVQGDDLVQHQQQVQQDQPQQPQHEQRDLNFDWPW